MQYILHFHYNNGCTNAPKRYVVRTPPPLFCVRFSEWTSVAVAVCYSTLLHEDVWMSGGLAPSILKLLATWKWVVNLTLPPLCCHYWVIWDPIRDEVAKMKPTCLILPRTPVFRPASLIIPMTELRFTEFMGKLHLFLRHLVVSRSQAAGGCSAGDVTLVLLHQVELFVVWK
jgi:hypothetical protein